VGASVLAAFALVALVAWPSSCDAFESVAVSVATSSTTHAGGVADAPAGGHGVAKAPSVRVDRMPSAGSVRMRKVVVALAAVVILSAFELRRRDRWAVRFRTVRGLRSCIVPASTSRGPPLALRQRGLAIWRGRRITVAPDGHLIGEPPWPSSLARRAIL
jgi:hypothetical protein